MNKKTTRLFNIIRRVTIMVVLPAFITSILPSVPVYAGHSSPYSSIDFHYLKLNIYDSTNLTTMIETCDSIKADQEKNNTYTEESYKKLMAECEEGKNILDCLDKALADTTGSLDASECEGSNEEKMKDAITKLVSRPPSNNNRPVPPNTGTWYLNILGKTYAISVVTFAILAVTTLVGICIAIYLIHKRIKAKGISGINIANPWNKESYELLRAQKLVEKHKDDPLTEMIDMSKIIKKYRIKFALWHTIPIAAIIAAFLTLILVTAPTMASAYASIDIITTNDSMVTIINIDKASVGSSTNVDITNIEAIETSIHGGGSINPENGVFASYGPDTSGLDAQVLANFDVLLDGMTIISHQSTPSGDILPDVYLSEESEEIITSVFGPLSDTLAGEHTFPHMLTLNLDNIQNIAVGTYWIDIRYEISVKPPPTTPSVEPLTTGCGLTGTNHGHVGSMQSLTQTTANVWSIYDYGVVTDIRNEQDYYICKLPDGKVWMLNNLKLGSPEGPLNLTPADTNIANSWTLPQVTSGAYESWNQPIVESYGYGSSQTDITATNFYGYYYNWCAATAGGLASGGSSTCVPSGVVPNGATNDICPANWRLPIDGDFYNLRYAMPNNIASWTFDGPFRGALAGMGSSGEGLSAVFWSSSIDYDEEEEGYPMDGIWAFIINNPYFSVFSYARHYQANIRCLLR